MKIYRGMKRRMAIKRLRRWRFNLLNWAVSVKPGDYIGTCDGCNRKVAKIDFLDWGYDSNRRGTRLLSEVVFEDTHGYLHYCPGGGCAYPAETPEQVTAYFRGWAFDPASEEFLFHWWGKDEAKIKEGQENLRRFQEALKSGAPIVDAHGELLPEFDRKRS